MSLIIKALCSSYSITAAEMAPFVEVLLTNLFKALTLPGSSENEYIMKGKRWMSLTVRVTLLTWSKGLSPWATETSAA